MTPEYAAVAEFYGTRCTCRSGVRLMNHIDEGLQILTWIGGSDWSVRGPCLHLLVQEAHEYRAVANVTLSYRDLAGAHDIAFSPIRDVNDMLVDDKVQNYTSSLSVRRVISTRDDSGGFFWRAAGLIYPRRIRDDDATGPYPPVAGAAIWREPPGRSEQPGGPGPCDWHERRRSGRSA